MDECAASLNQCATAALCVNTVGSYTCSCPEGYVGDGQQNGSGCMGKVFKIMFTCIIVDRCH